MAKSGSASAAQLISGRAGLGAGGGRLHQEGEAAVAGAESEAREHLRDGIGHGRVDDLDPVGGGVVAEQDQRPAVAHPEHRRQDEIGDLVQFALDRRGDEIGARGGADEQGRADRAVERGQAGEDRRLADRPVVMASEIDQRVEKGIAPTGGLFGQAVGQGARRAPDRGHAGGAGARPLALEGVVASHQRHVWRRGSGVPAHAQPASNGPAAALRPAPAPDDATQPCITIPANCLPLLIFAGCTAKDQVRGGGAQRNGWAGRFVR
jgi:hypothetical protein